MKYNNLSLSIIIFFSLCIFCNQSTIAQDCEYAEYYSLTNLARESYSAKKYKDAQKYFQLAFSKTEFSFGEDLHLALFTANKLKDDSWAIAIAQNLAKGGIPLRYFVRFKNEKWYSAFESEFSDFSKYYEENFNSKLRQIFLDLVKKDTDFNEMYHQWRTHEIEMSLDDLIEKASGIISDFEKLVEKYGFPYEKLIGYNYMHRKNSVASYDIFVLMVHTYQRGVSFLKDELSQIVCEGGLAPDRANTLRNIDISENNIGVEQNMKARYLKYREKD